jgi:hypothetical protein
MDTENKYKGGMFVKLANPSRRIQAIRFEGGWLFTFKTLDGYKKIRTQHLKLSNEAVRGLVNILAKMAVKDAI